MKIEQCLWHPSSGWESALEPKLGSEADLVIFYTSTAILKENPIIGKLKEYYPKAEIVGGGSMGQILGQKMEEESLVLTAVHFEHGRVQVVSASVDGIGKSEELGTSLVSQLSKEELKHVYVIGDGVGIAGVEFVNGLSKELSPSTGLTGGFAVDTLFHNKILPTSSSAIAVGFYGDLIQVAYSAMAGWKSYGPVWKVTKAEGEILYELDGKPALDLYKEFLGPFAKELPEIGLLYPISVWESIEKPQECIARTFVGINEDNKSLRFAGSIPSGGHAQFMLTNTDLLVEGAETAAQNTLKSFVGFEPELAFMMTCASRKAVMKQRAEEELEAVSEILGKNTAYAGCISWGEISPFRFSEKCFFQNQVMAITAIREAKS